MLRKFLFGVVAACVIVATAASAEPMAPLDTSSPAASLRSFTSETARIEALFLAYRDNPTTAGQLELARRLARLGTQLFDLHEVPPAIRAKTGNAAVGFLADILNRLPDVSKEIIPGATAQAGTSLPARWTIPGTELRLVRLDSAPRAGDYVFSADTIARLPELHAQIIGMPLHHSSAVESWALVQQNMVGPWLAHLPLAALPKFLHAPVAGTPVWKILFVLILSAVIFVAVRRWARFVRRWTDARADLARLAIRITVPALLALLVFLGHGFVLWQLVLSIQVSDIETMAAIIALYTAGAWAAWVGCWLLAELIIASPTFPDDTYDAHLVRILARVGSLLAVGAIIVYGANDIGVPALGLLAGVSVGGIALALAAQSTVENLLGGIAIFADRPFRVGDQVRFGANAGTVETVGPRSTRIRDVDGALTTVPNADLAKAQITNVSSRANSLFRHSITLPNTATSQRIEALLQDLRERISAHPLVEQAMGAPRVRLVSLGPVTDGVVIEIFARIQTTSAIEFLEVQETLLLDIMRAVEASGIEWVQPDEWATRDIHRPVPGAGAAPRPA